MSPAPASPPGRAHVIVGTAGHIDHGKTALVYALTGTDTDRLPEEKSRGITIDLGFADLQLHGEHGPPLALSLIDVPGHHAFIRNMLAGAAGIDCVLLVIAADEGIKPQAEEHLAICSLLGITRGLVVLTKSDLVAPDRLAAVRSSIAHALAHTFLAQAPILAVSALTGQGIPELKLALYRLASQGLTRPANHVPRLPIDRAFSVRGFGSVVTGTLHGGPIHTGQELVLYPAARSVRIRGMQVHRNTVPSATAPCRVALNLAGIEVAELSRGDTLVPPATLAPTREFAAELTMLPGHPLPRHRSTVRLHAFSAESLATVLLFDTAPESGLRSDAPHAFARLKLAHPMVLLPGDRFVLRQASPALTLGGGRVLDPHLPRMRNAESHRWLQQLAALPDDSPERLYLRIARRGASGLTAAALTRETGLLPQIVLHQLEPLLTSGRLCPTQTSPDSFLTAQALEHVAQQLLHRVQQRPAHSIPRAELRSQSHLAAPVFELALRTLALKRSVTLTSDAVTLAGAQSAPSPQHSGDLLRVEQLYRTAGLASPLLSEVSTQLALSPDKLRALITQLLRAKTLVRMGADNLFIHAEALTALAERLRQHRGERFDVARFKTFTGLTRKHAIPLLEHLDGQRITRNDNGTRTVL